MSAINLHS